MSYGAAAALQAAVFQRLTADSAITALVGGAIHDSVPPGNTAGTYVSIGPEDALDASSQTSQGASHDFVVSVVTDQPGFEAAKSIAAAVSDALTGATLVLSRGHLLGLWFLRARARRVGQGSIRRIDLSFRARIED